MELSVFGGLRVGRVAEEREGDQVFAFGKITYSEVQLYLGQVVHVCRRGVGVIVLP